MNIDRFFPTVVATDMNPNHNKYANLLIEKCLHTSKNIDSGGKNWISNSTYNTLNTYNISKVKEFKNVNKFVLDSVKNFCDEIKIDFNKLNHSSGDAWFNISKKGDYQEYHYHAGSVLSVVYYLKTPKDCTKLFFKNPINDMIAPQYTEDTMDNFEFGYIKPKDGMIVIFRSHLEHCVEKQKTDDSRISLAYNFYKKQ